jgi:hypothetical protein
MVSGSIVRLIFTHLYLRFKRADMWSSGGAQKLPVADIANLVDSINRRLPDANKIDAKDVLQHLSRSAKDKDFVHINLNQFLEALSAMSAPAPPSSPAAAEVAAIASAHLALLPGQFSDDLMQKCLAIHGRNTLLQTLRAMNVPESLLREALVPLQSPAAINYVKLVLISAGITQASPAEQEAKAAMQAAGMFAAAQEFTKAAVSSGYNEDLSLPAGARLITARFPRSEFFFTGCRFGKPRSCNAVAAWRSSCFDEQNCSG